MQFIYPPTNSIRLVQLTAEIDARYNTVPFDLYTPEGCYSQKRQFSDTEHLQCLSDWVPLLTIYNAETGATITTINPTTPATGIQGQTFQLYEFTIAWNTIAVDCYIEITYEDEVWQSGIIQIKQEWPNTLLFEYTNSTNKFSTVFDTGINMNSRIEAAIYEYQPEFDDVIYNDQNHNTTLLNAIPFRTFTLYIPGREAAIGLPQWMIDRVNWIFACDQVKIDGVWYRNNSGAKWEVSRSDPDGNEFIGGKLQIIETNNLFLLSLKTGAEEPQSYRIVSLAADKQNISGNTSFDGIFTAYSKLNSITIRNRGTSFTVKAGITSGGDQVLNDTIVDNGANTFEVNYFFQATANLYFTIPTGSDIDIFLEWTQFDAPAIVPGRETVIYKGRPDSVGMYKYTSSTQFALDWDASTGLGLGRYAGAALLDGRFGRDDWGLRTPFGYKANATWADIGITDQTGVIPFNSQFGSTSTILIPENLPPLRAHAPAANAAGSGRIQFNGGGTGDINAGVTGESGQILQSRAFSNIHPVVYTIFYIELNNE